MENEKIKLTEKELLFIQSLESKLNVTEYSEVTSIIQKYIQLARNENWKVKTYEERYKGAEKREEEYYEKYKEEEKEKDKWESYYRELCNKYAKLEIELDLAKTKIWILEGEKENGNNK